MAKYPYINYGGEATLPPPFGLNETTLHGFFFETDINAVQDMVNKRLNFPADSNYRYEVFNSYALVSFARIGRGTSLATQKKHGYAIENEMLIWVLLIEKVKSRTGWKPNRTIWFVPYIIVDSFLGVISGREVYGLPKTLGETEIPRQPEDASYFSSKVLGFKHYYPSSLMQDYQVISVTKDSFTRRSVVPWQTGKEIVRDLRKVMLESKNPKLELDIEFCCNGIRDLLTFNFHWIFLKQFRGIKNDWEACYQAIADCEYHLKPETFKGGSPYPNKYILNVPEVESYPLSKDLGFTSGQKSKFGFWLKMDSECRTGRVLWTPKK